MEGKYSLKVNVITWLNILTQNSMVHLTILSKYIIFLKPIVLCKYCYHAMMPI